MCWRPWAINMRQHLWNLPLNSHVGCDRTTGAPSQASNDTVTCITRPLLQCGGSPLVPPPPALVLCCLAPKAERCSVMWFLIFFFSPPSKLKGRSRAAEGAQLAFLLSRRWMQRRRPVSSTRLFVSRSVRLLLLRHGGGNYWEHEHQKVGDSGSYAAFVPGVCLHGRRFNW